MPNHRNCRHIMVSLVKLQGLKCTIALICPANMRGRGEHAYGVRSADMYPGTAHCQCFCFPRWPPTMLFLAISSQIPSSHLGPTMLQNLKFPTPTWVPRCVIVSHSNSIVSFGSNFRSGFKTGDPTCAAAVGSSQNFRSEHYEHVTVTNLSLIHI